MTEVAFHLNVPDRDVYVCRLLRKAHAKGARVWVVAEEEELVVLDRALWTLAQGEFIPHARSTAAPQVLKHSPILLSTSDQGGGGVLVNLSSRMPMQPAAFDRVIEVVAPRDDARAQARQRWKQYRDAGLQPQAIDFADRSAG